MLANSEYDKAKQAVLSILMHQQAPILPAELLEQLDERGIDNGISRGAIWALIDGNLVDFTFDQRLQYVHSTPDLSKR
jgi:hypothetical protein